MTHHELERLAICLESGVPAERAEAIARCEGYRETARAAGKTWRCVCGTHGGGA